jgi:hypothetical protein
VLTARYCVCACSAYQLRSAEYRRDVLSALESGKGHQSIPHMGPPAEKMNPDLVGLNRPTLSARQFYLKK